MNKSCKEENTTMEKSDEVVYSGKDRNSLYNEKVPNNDEQANIRNFYCLNDVKSIEKELLDGDGKDMMNEMELLKIEESLATPKFIFINQTDNTYHEALQDLKKESSIAVGTEGANFGRKCKLPVLTLATRSQTYIFDIQVMQEAAFELGIKDLLESATVKKIIHNSRKLSDCLWNKHRVELNNVFDTQVADVIIQKNKMGYLPAKVKSLQECVVEYLHIPDKKVIEKVDIVEWSQRPMSALVKQVSCRHVGLLPSLHTAMIEAMQAPFLRGVQDYLDCQRRSTDGEAWLLSSKDGQLPKSFAKAIYPD